MPPARPRVELRSGDWGELHIANCANGDVRVIGIYVDRQGRDTKTLVTNHLDSVASSQIARFVLDRDVLAISRLRRDGVERARFGPIGRTDAKPATAAELALPFFATDGCAKPLYPFQQAGVRRLVSSDAVLLADDMGLGKTIQVARALAEISQEALGFRALVVAPVTLLDNWQRELSAWAPFLVCRKGRSLGNANLARRTHVLLLSFEELANHELVQSSRWNVVVVDEAHRLRNSESQRSMAFRSVNRDRLWLTTGTPIENRPDDLSELLRVLAPHRFSADRLGGNPEVVRAAAKEFTLRRTKDQVLSELPSLQEHDVAVSMTPLQRGEYDRVDTGRDRRLRHQLERVGALRQLCDLFRTDSGKLDWLAEFYRQIARDEKVVVFSSFLAVLELGHARFADSALMTGSIDPDIRTRLVKTFQECLTPRILFISQKVGAEGLTLTRANHVVFINEWWNPSATEQAVDRVRRIGQQRAMHCYRLYTPNTIEDRVRQLLAEKSADSRRVLTLLCSEFERTRA